MRAYYNEIDPKAAAWLRELIKQGHIAKGEVDERSILDVRPDDLAGFSQCHFFAGIGVWSYALRRAGWADDRPVWTGSCPCQPFSAAGKGDEFADERHLWPAWFRLIRERRPVAVFGEQVASKDALSWLDHVSTDLEAEGYAVGAVDTCAAGFGAPHIRQRLYFVADASDPRRSGTREHDGGQPQLSARFVEHGDMGNPSGRGLGIERDAAQQGSGGHADGAGELVAATRLGTGDDRRTRIEFVGDTGCDRLAQQQRERGIPPGAGRADEGQTAERAGPSATNGFWSNAEWIPCRDGKARPTEPGTFPLVTGAPARVVRLRGYGNAINAEQARHFIEAYQEGSAA